MTGRDFLRAMRAAERAVLERVAAEAQAREAYAQIQHTVTAGIVHAADEPTRLRILDDARRHYVQQRVQTDHAIDARTQLLVDRISDSIAVLARTAKSPFSREHVQ